MGTGSSFLRGGNKDAEDDVMGTGNGVVKTIPNEVRCGVMIDLTQKATDWLIESRLSAFSLLLKEN